MITGYKYTNIVYFIASVIIMASLSLILSIRVFATEGTWMKDPSGWWLVNIDGTYLTDSWLNTDEAWYYLNSEGYMQTGWLKSDSKFYRLRNTGDMMIGWFFDDDANSWYYMDETGAMTTGWVWVEDNWYWMSGKGKMFSDGFKSIDGQQYYFHKDGKMAMNCYVGTSYIDSTGKKDSTYDMRIEGGKKPSNEESTKITDSLSNIPRKLLKAFVDSGWQFIYYSNKSYLGAINTGQDGIFYERFKIDTNYKKIKFCQGSNLAAAFGEYFNAVYGKPASDSDFGITLDMEWDKVMHCFNQPTYYKTRTEQSFGALFALYYDLEGSELLKEDALFFYNYIEDTINEILNNKEYE